MLIVVKNVTILILVDGFLQLIDDTLEHCVNISHNPYFSRWFSAIRNFHIVILMEISHNPYFSRWFSAIRNPIMDKEVIIMVTILILVDGFLQFVYDYELETEDVGHNPYFSRWFSAIL